MIAVDTSALLAIVLKEPAAEDCLGVLRDTQPVLISAGTLAEALIVGSRRGVGAQVENLISGLSIQVQPVSAHAARRAAAAYERWGKGIHPAHLNFADCFAYALAEQYGCPLLFIGNDFAQTDITSALAAEQP